LYLVFEFVAHDLKTYMDQFQTSDDISERVGLPVPSVRSFLRQIIAGVGCCHTYRILHRDLKPHNLLISGDGKQVKLADFGLARLSAVPSGPYTFEVVTLWYRAPELLLGANRYSTSVDVWSIGCIFAEMASGMPLFPGRSDIDQLFKIFQRRGTPTAETWPAVLRLPHYNSEFPQWRERPITDVVPTHAMGGHAGADLLNKLLHYDPDRRIACKTALQHPFFLQE
jgi:cyclin-dependent kinase